MKLPNLHPRMGEREALLLRTTFGYSRERPGRGMVWRSLLSGA